jgi:hypothetical protein
VSDLSEIAAYARDWAYAYEQVPPSALSRAGPLYDIAEMLEALPPPPVPDDAFEQWLVERWLSEIRSEAFRSSAQFERLLAEWERGRG